MTNEHLYILHLFPNTEDETVNKVAQIRHDNLLAELENQGITQFTLIPGEFDKVNTKRVINRGHKKIVQIAKDLGLKSVNIMEDDCVFSSPNSWEYFLSQIPSVYSLFTALIYNGEVDDTGRIKNGMSGTHTLYNLHNSMYDFVLSQPDDVHCDRNAGMYAHQFNYFVCQPMCVTQRGTYSYQLKRPMDYSPYLIGKKLYGVD